MVTPTAVVLEGLAEIRRGVRDPQAVAAFIGWALGIEPVAAGNEARLPCRNGDLVYTTDPEPVAIGWRVGRGVPPPCDPDGVPVAAVAAGGHGKGPALDHVRLNCADLAATARFYRSSGLRVTWAADPDGEPVEVAEDAMDGADWAHLSATDGYLSLSQADWAAYGTHTTASGPPRFMHIGLAVGNLDEVTARLDSASVEYWKVDGPVGSQLYLNDPEGDAAVGMNVELVQYDANISRSGQLV